MAKEYFLGVDGGGTKTAAAIMDRHGRIVAKAVGGGSNYRALGENVAQRNLKRTVLKAAKKFKGKIKYACFGLASVDTVKDRKNARRFIERCNLSTFLGCPISIVNDIEIILPAITDKKRGIAAIGGTGSNFYGVNGKRTAKAAGVDYILSDEGSSYDIGLKALRAAVRDKDGRGKRTLLTRMVFRKARVKSVSTLKDAVHEGLKAEIASFAPLTEAAAKRGDRIAKRILAESAREYVTGIKAVTKALNLKGKFDIAFTGKLFSRKVIYNDVRRQVRKFAPKARFYIVEEAVIGAAKLAMTMSER